MRVVGWSEKPAFASYGAAVFARAKTDIAQGEALGGLHATTSAFTKPAPTFHLPPLSECGCEKREGGKTGKREIRGREKGKCTGTGTRESSFEAGKRK